MPEIRSKHPLYQSIHNKKRVWLVTASSLVLGIALSPVLVSTVSARQGSDDAPVTSSTGSTGSTEPTSSPTPPASTSGSSGSGSGGGTNDSHKKGGDSRSSLASQELEVEHQVETQKAEAEKHAEDAKTKADELRIKIEDDKGKAEKKLDDTKLKICQKRENNIGVIMGRVGERAQKQLDMYTTVSTRVQAFYTDKKLTVTNYDQLVADISAKKVLAQAAIDKVKADKAAFKCDGTDPTGTVDIFKADTAAQNEALKAYRASIKALLVAVKAAAQAVATTPAPAPTPAPVSPQGVQQ